MKYLERIANISPLSPPFAANIVRHVAVKMRLHYVLYAYLYAVTLTLNKARTLKAKAKAMAIPMQRLTMKYVVMKPCFFEYSYKDTSTV